MGCWPSSSGNWGREAVDRVGRNNRRDAAATVRYILAGHVQRHERPRGLGTPVALRRRELKPLIGLDPRLGRILWQSFEAGAMELHADVMLGPSVAKGRRALHPPH